MRIEKYMRLHGKSLTADGKELPFSGIDALYRERLGDYPKYFKMDLPSKVATIAARMLCEMGDPDEGRAVILFSRCGSLADDILYAQSMAGFPSPALFVYTLANVPTGEVSIALGFKGESASFILPRFDADAMAGTIEDCFTDRTVRSAICLWLDAPDSENIDLLATTIYKDGNEDITNTLTRLYENG